MVRVIVRDRTKLAPEIRGRVEAVEGSHDDATVVAKACAGAESYFLLAPPSFRMTNGAAYYMRFTTPLIAAIKNGNIKRVVAVSAAGRGVPLRAGVVSDSLTKDEAIEATGVNFRALWCPGFYENMLRQVEPIKHQGTFFYPGIPDLKTPTLRPGDIAATAAKLLLDQSWTGQGGVGVFGPEDLSWNDIAAIMADVLGQPIRFQPVPYQDYKKQLVQRGASEEMAASLVEMHEAKDKGLDNAEPRTPENTTPTASASGAKKC